MRIFYLLFLLPIALFAKPKGGKVIAGTAEVREAGSHVSIQTSNRAIIHWDEFSIHAGEKTQFIQPEAHSAVLNRVKNGISHIDGFLEGNGRIYLVNPRGIVIGKEGVVKAASFIASTLDLDNEDFFKNQTLLFKGKSEARIVNLGKVEALGGDVMLFAKAIVNEGSLKAKKGIVGIAAGEEILLKPSGEQRLFIAPAKDINKGDGGIENCGVIEAAQAELRADGNVFRFAINQSGVIDATGIKQKQGRVYLVADGGTVVNSGKICAANKDKTGGSIHLLGDQVGVLEKGEIEVSGQYGGGEVLIGGDYQGQNPLIQNATMSVVMPGAMIHADAIEKGDGGKIIVWSDEIALMQGHAFARGGREEGDGGLVEVSGLHHLEMSGHVDTSAPKGKMGNLLLDPSNVAIRTGATTGVSFSAATGIFTPTDVNVFIANIPPTVPNLTDVLETNPTNITVTTASSFGNLGGLSVLDGVTWTSDNSLTLRADADIIIEEGSGGLVNTGGGSIFLESGGNIFFLANTIAMEGMISASASGNIFFSPRSTALVVMSVNGSVTLSAGSSVNVASGVAAENTTIVGTLNGGLNINCGLDLNVEGPDTAGFFTLLEMGAGPGFFNVGRDLIVRGSFVDTAAATFGGTMPSTGDMTLNVGRNVLVEGGLGSSSPAILGNTGAGTSSMTFNVGGDVRVAGGSGSLSSGVLGIDGAGSGDLLFSVEGDVRVLGGNGSSSHAAIGLLRGNAAGMIAHAGNVTFDLIGGEVEVRGGLGADSFAHIGHVNGQTLEAGYQSVGNVFLQNISGDVLVESRSAPAAIGHGNNITLGDDAYIGSVVVDTRRDIEINASSLTPTAIGCIFGGVMSSSLISERIEVSARNLLINAAAGGDAYVGIHVSSDMIPANATIGVVDVTVRDDLKLNPSSTVSFTLDGSAAIGGYAENGIARANVQIQAGDVFLNTFSGVDGAKSRIVSSHPSLMEPLEVQILANNLFATSAGEIFSSGNLQAISNFTTFLGALSSVQSSLGQVTLVVDNAFPEEPEIGNGQFIIENGAVLSSANSLRIFTARRSQNTIAAPLNGAIFAPGAIFIDSDAEQWGAYFPDSFGGIPFTVFYKSGIPAEIYNDQARILSEMFQNLKTYDELLFSCKYFLLGYDKACYDQLLHPKGMLSSFDLFHEEAIDMLKQNYRNYHTKYFESF